MFERFVNAVAILHMSPACEEVCLASRETDPAWCPEWGRMRSVRKGDPGIGTGLVGPVCDAEL